MNIECCIQQSRVQHAGVSLFAKQAKGTEAMEALLVLDWTRCNRLAVYIEAE